MKSVTNSFFYLIDPVQHRPLFWIYSIIRLVGGPYASSYYLFTIWITQWVVVNIQ